MLTWMVSVASMVRKLVYEREIQLEEVSGLGEGKGQQLGVTGYPVCLAGSHCPRRLVHLEAPCPARVVRVTCLVHPQRGSEAGEGPMRIADSVVLVLM